MKMIDRSALFADETELFRFPYQAEAGDVITFRFRAKRDDLLKVVLTSPALSQEMEKAFSLGKFDYYETSLKLGKETLSYGFRLSGEEEELYFDRLGAGERAFSESTAFQVIPGFRTPSWARGAVMYQIFTDRFRNGECANDTGTNEYVYNQQPVSHAEWDSPVSDYDVRRFYGGDLQGVREKLDYLQYLGVEVIYFNPLFVSPSNHKYDTQDYDHIDPHLSALVHDGGDVLPENETDNRKASMYIRRVTDPENLAAADAYFAELVEEIHRRGMRVILDGVFNHCGSFHKWMDREHIYEGQPGYAAGAYEGREKGDGCVSSPYDSYFLFEGTDEETGEPLYKGWWNHKTLPKLNYEGSDKLKAEVLGIAKKWLKPPYRIDGWRLDVAADLGQTEEYNHDFWKEFRKAVKEENPDALILAEHYGDPKKWLSGDQWDSVMNYDAFMDPVGYFLTGMEKHSNRYEPLLHGNGEEFFRSLAEKSAAFPVQSLQTAMNELSNHDHTRFLTRTNCRTGDLLSSGAAAASEGVSYATFRAGIVMQMTLPGAPTVYYGDETGMTGWTDPDSRRPFPWGHESWDLISFHKDLIRIHKTYSCLKYGSFKPVLGESGLIAYGRFDKKNTALILVLYHEKDREVCVDVSDIEMPENGKALRVMETHDAGYNVGRKEFPIVNGKISLTLKAWSSIVLVAERIE